MIESLSATPPLSVRAISKKNWLTNTRLMSPREHHDLHSQDYTSWMNSINASRITIQIFKHNITEGKQSWPHLRTFAGSKLNVVAPSTPNWPLATALRQSFASDGLYWLPQQETFKSRTQIEPLTTQSIPKRLSPKRRKATDSALSKPEGELF